MTLTTLDLNLTTLDYVVMDSIGIIKRELSYSYPYKAGSIIMNCKGFDRKTLLEICKYFLEHHCVIEINYEKNQVKISGYIC